MFGRYAGHIKATARALLVDGDIIRLFAEREPARLPWSDLGIDVVVEMTGKFTSRDPLIKVLDDTFGLEQGFVSVVHAYTADQLLVDGAHKDARRARAAAVNIVPTTSGAARATQLVLATRMSPNRSPRTPISSLMTGMLCQAPLATKSQSTLSR